MHSILEAVLGQIIECIIYMVISIIVLSFSNPLPQMKDGVLIGVFATRGYLAINKRGRSSNGRTKLTPVARASSREHIYPLFVELAEDFGGVVVPAKMQGWTIEFTLHSSVQQVCDVLSMSPYPLPELLDNQVEIMLRFLSYPTRPGPSQKSRAYEGRLQAYLDMQALKGR